MALDVYNQRARDYADSYESVQTEQVHGEWLSVLPDTKLLVLDVGAGSGRDAAWFARKGHEVVAVEPANEMRDRAQRLHPHPAIHWIDDRLPALEEVHAFDYRFDVILLSAVWMHVPESQRDCAFRKLTDLLKPGGLLVFTLRSEPADDGRAMYPVSAEDLRHRANQRALEVLRDRSETADAIGRKDVQWSTVVFRLPDDGTGALPLIRHILINDSTSSTYKPALLRILARIADGAPGSVTRKTTDFVDLPLGLVALYWIKGFYRPILLSGLQQQPGGNGSPGFVDEHFQHLQQLSPDDIRVGARFTGETATHVIEAIRRARDTVRNMPAHYITYPGSSDSVFHTSIQTLRGSSEVTLNQSFLRGIGIFRVPRMIWDALSRHACWIEPAAVSRWSQLMMDYSSGHGEALTRGQALQSLEWMQHDHNTSDVRQIVQEVQEQGHPIYDVWTGTRIHSRFEVDHCFPFTYWPNNDLWNLLPVTSSTNSRKSARLPSAEMVEQAEDRILSWWESAYEQPPHEQRFFQEASTSLPVFHGDVNDLEDVLAGLSRQRIRLKTDQQIEEWTSGV
jgi:SAM-dependent methyltransferase